MPCNGSSLIPTRTNKGPPPPREVDLYSKMSRAPTRSLLSGKPGRCFRSCQHRLEVYSLLAGSSLKQVPDYP